jgi:hypothetical protein
MGTSLASELARKAAWVKVKEQSHPECKWAVQLVWRVPQQNFLRMHLHKHKEGQEALVL